MRLFYKQYEVPFVDQSEFSLLVIEHAKEFYSIQFDLVMQIAGDGSNFILSNSKGLLQFEKELDWIPDPWSLDLNGRKITGNLHSYLVTTLQERGLDLQLIQKWTEIEEILVNSFVDETSVVMNRELIGLQQLLKHFEVKLEDSFTKELPERIMDYCLAKTRFEGKRVFIFNQIFSYLETVDIIELINFSKIEEIFILVLERNLPLFNDVLKGRCLVIDQDLCEIIIRES